jgi:hypothetical protein
MYNCIGKVIGISILYNMIDSTKAIAMRRDVLADIYIIYFLKNNQHSIYL